MTDHPYRYRRDPERYADAIDDFRVSEFLAALDYLGPDRAADEIAHCPAIDRATLLRLRAALDRHTRRPSDDA